MKRLVEMGSNDFQLAWLDLLRLTTLRYGVLNSKFEIYFALSSIPLQIYQLARDTVVLLLECNPDMGQLLEWVIDRCYTSEPREADACFLALAAIFSAR